MFVYSTSSSEVCTTRSSTLVTTICHGSLEGISSIKLKSGCLSRASPRPLGTTLLPSASMVSAFPDSTHKWGHTAWLFCIRPTACARVSSRDVIWQGSLLLWMISISFSIHADCKQSPALTANKATRRRPPAQFCCAVSYIQTWTFAAEGTGAKEQQRQKPCTVM